MIKESYSIIKDYSEYSSVQGILYIFQSKQTTFGKIFWSAVVFLMIVLGCYWSLIAYNDWVNNPVVTTINTTAYPVGNLDFPAVTICAQGTNEDILGAGFFKLFLNFLKEKDIALDISPFKASTIMLKMLRQKQNLTEQEVNEAGLVIKYFANNTDNMASKFFDAILPGWTLNDPYNLAAPLMISKNPGAVLLSIAIFKNQETCNNFNMSSLPKCETGFVLDQISGWCFKFLEQELNFWQASDACLELVSDLVEFESDLDVKGFVQYLRSDNRSHSKESWINAFGTPQTGFKYRASLKFVNTTKFELLKLTNTMQDYNFCLKGKYTQIGNITTLNMITTICNVSILAVCRKKSFNPQACNSQNVQTNLMNKKFDSTLNFMTKMDVRNLTITLKSMFDKIDKTSSYESLFSMLWYSTLPCFDLNGVTSETDGEKSILKSCFWRGVKISCSAIFNTFPTDQGMCCAFNMNAADQIFQSSTYLKLVLEKQQENNYLSFTDFTIPDSFKNDEKKAMPGMNKGLTIVIDGHNDLLGGTSIDSDYKSFIGVVSDKGSYPLTGQDGFQIKPGHYNFIGISGTKISAYDAIRILSPNDRKCRFSDETYGLKIHTKYSLSNCLLECSITYAQSMMFTNQSKVCTPWFLPPIDKLGTICDPWEAVAFEKYFNNVTDNFCTECLPDCDKVQYDTSITTIPFRKCDFRNLGVSTLCSISNPLPPKPQIWSRQVLTEIYKAYGINTTIPEKIGVTPSLRSYEVKLAPPGIFNFINETYDAYDEDIAVVEFYFKKSSVIEFSTNVRLTWIDFFSAIGGLLGLCIGVSIVTFVELFWLSLRLVGNAIKPSSKQQQ